MLKLFSKNKTIYEEQQDFFKYLEKIVNIALVKTERGDNQSVKEILNDLGNIFRKFWQLRKDRPDKFNALLWSKDFFENYIQPIEKDKNLITEDTQRTKSVEELRKEAAFRLAFSAGTELKGLTQFINSFEKIWECAFRYDNDEISRYVVYHMIWLLDELVQEPSNDLFVKQYLKTLNVVTWKAIKFSKKELNHSVYAASFHWYGDIVFNRLKKKGFDLSYLELFDNFFFNSIKYIISENQNSLFEALISYLIDGISIPSYNKGKIWEYVQIISDFQKFNKLDIDYKLIDRINDLANSVSDLDSKEELNEWLKKFDEIKKILEPIFNDEQKKEAIKIEEDIKDLAVSRFKYSNLLEIVTHIGAYCLFKQKAEYIKYLWEYKQPPDSDAAWMGEDIIPNNLDSLVKFYFKKNIFGREFNLWEDHHGSELYYKKYFLLLLAHNLKNLKPNSEGKYGEIENFNLPKLNIHQLSNLEHSIDELIEITNDLKKQIDIWKALDFDITKLHDFYNDKLIPFLKILKTKSQEQIRGEEITQKISNEKVEEFKELVIKSYNHSIIVQTIFKYYELYEDRTNEKYAGKLERFGLNRIDNRAAFFEDWHVLYIDWGSSYGRDLASGEDSYILETIASYCKEIKDNTFDGLLEKLSNLSDIFVLTSIDTLYKFFEISRNFKPAWQKDSAPLKLNGFEGWYSFKDCNIPVFLNFNKKSDKQIMILNKSKLGKLIQYSPLNVGETEGSRKGIFFMNIQDFSEKEDLIEKFLNKPPEWLIKIGDKQREYLKGKVLIHVFERFEIVVPKDFEGYLLKLSG